MSADDLQVLVKTDHHLTVCLNTFIWLLHNQIHTSINTCITSLGNENSAFRKDGTKSKIQNVKCKCLCFEKLKNTESVIVKEKSRIDHRYNC